MNNTERGYKGVHNDKPVKPSAKNTCAVVVTYFPDDDVRTRLNHLQEQLTSIIIVDNASGENCLSILRDFAKSPTVKLLENDLNKGIAEALNQGIALAIELGFSWVLTLDQDTRIHDDMFDVLTEIYESCGFRSPLIGSNYWDVHRERAYLSGELCENKIYVEQRTIITAGTLLKLDLFRKIGGFRSDYFIDSVDHEYCLRARKNGYKVLSSCKPLMSQSIGRPNVSGDKVRIFDHPTIRRYYIARNSLVTAKTYMWKEPIWALRQVVGISYSCLSVVFRESDKKSKLDAYMRGIIDAIRNKMGPCDWI